MDTPTQWRGQKCKDVVSGFVGTAIARYDYINGCVRFELAGVNKDGAPESWVFDEQQIEWTGKFAKGFEPVTAAPLKATGGDRSPRPVRR